MPEFHNVEDVTVTLGAQKRGTWVVELPWPSPRLSPNARGHWATTSTAKKAYRKKCRELGEAAGLALVPKAPTEVKVHLTFVPPDKRRRDWDNMLASMKSGLDGLADAMGVDDNRWRLAFDVSDDPVENGIVLVTVEVTA